MNETLDTFASHSHFVAFRFHLISTNIKENNTLNAIRIRIYVKANSQMIKKRIENIENEMIKFYTKCVLYRTFFIDL